MITATANIAAAGSCFAKVSEEPLLIVRMKALTAPNKRKLSFGLITPGNAELILKLWNTFTDRKGHATDATINDRKYATQGEPEKDCLEGQLDLAWLGNASSLEIV